MLLIMSGLKREGENGGLPAKWQKRSAFNDAKLCDVTIKCGDTVFSCSKSMLATTEYFYTLFHSDYAENKKGEVEFSPENIRVDHLRLFLEYLHDRSVTIPPSLEMTELIEIYDATHLFGDADWLKAIADRVQAQSNNHPEAMVQYWYFVAKYELVAAPVIDVPLAVLYQIPFSVFPYLFKAIRPGSSIEPYRRLTVLLQWTVLQTHKQSVVEHYQFNQDVREYIQQQINEKNLYVPQVHKDVLTVLTQYAGCPALGMLIATILMENINEYSRYYRSESSLLDLLPYQVLLREIPKLMVPHDTAETSEVKATS